MSAFTAIGKETICEIQSDRAFEGAAALAYYLTLATFPALIALIALIPFLPVDGLEATITDLISKNLPANIGNLIVNITDEALSNRNAGLLSGGFIGALWASSSGMSAVINQLNVAYDVENTRNVVIQRLLAIGLTIMYLLLLIAASTLIVWSEFSTDKIRALLGQSTSLELILTLAQYVVAGMILLLAFALIYYLAPNQNQKFSYITPGSLLGTVLLIIGALGFDYYISNFGSYDKTYGSIGGVIVYMLWLYIAGFVLLFGAEINQVMTRHKEKELS